MKAAIFKQYGSPDQVMQYGDNLPLPVAGRQEVRIKMILSPIHNHNLSTIAGTYGTKPPLPAIGGSGGVGIIDAVGPDVTGLKVGQKIACGLIPQGSWAEYFIAPARFCLAVPDSLSDKDAAQLLEMPLSALLLLNRLKLSKGDWLIQNAASGSVGKNLALMAQEQGIDVLNLVRSEKSADEMRRMGFQHTISVHHEDWKEQIKKTTGNNPVKAAIDSIGGKAGSELLPLLDDEGTLVSFGALSGKPLEISPRDLIFKQYRINGFWATPLKEKLAVGEEQKLFEQLIQLLQKKKLLLPVEKIYPLSAIKEAIQASTTKGKKGKILLAGAS